MEFLESHPLFYKKLSMEIQLRAKELFKFSKYSIDDFINDAWKVVSEYNIQYPPAFG